MSLIKKLPFRQSLSQEIANAEFAYAAGSRTASRTIFEFFLMVLFIGAITACEKKNPTELHDVHWDRDMCERCKMVVSDRQNATQVINPATGRSYMYDDIGCAVLWFKEEKIEWTDKAKIWVTDITTGKWIDARTAFYDTNNITSMAYGFGAHENKATIKEGEEIINFTEVSKRIFEMEANEKRKAH